MTVYIECTHTLLRGGNTGIQRVVRNISNRAQQRGKALGVECIPVAWDGRGWVTVRHKLRTEPMRRVELTLRALGLAKAFVTAIHKGVGLLRGDSPLEGADGTTPTSTQRAPGTTRLQRLARTLLTTVQFGANRSYVVPGADDILLLIDSTWYDPPFVDGVRDARNRGARVGGLIHDTIPLDYPELVDDYLVSKYTRSFSDITPLFDFVLGTSGHALHTAKSHDSLSTTPSAVIPLGSDFDGTCIVRGSWSGRIDRFVVVGTIEPRKNHEMILAAFEDLWRTRPHVRLDIVGREGWKTKNLVTRLKGHPQLGVNLFWHESASDAFVQELYRHESAAALTASLVEGFGLPVVEALTFGTPVLASDIPPHREIGGDFCVYFNPYDADALANLLRRLVDGQLNLPDTEGFHWPGWDECVDILLNKAVSMAR